jgi:hypothetical protein
MQAAQVAEEEKRKSLEMELEIKKRISEAETNNAIKKSMIEGIFGLYQKGVPVPQELKMLEQEIIENIAMPIIAENVETINKAMQEAQMQQQMEQQAAAEAGMQAEGQAPPEEAQQQMQEGAPEGQMM